MQTNIFGCVGGGVEKFPKELWPKIPNQNECQTHLLTLYPSFYYESEKIRKYRISIFISLDNHALGGVRNSLANKFTVHSNDDLDKLNDNYALAIFYEVNEKIDEYNLSKFNSPRKYLNDMPNSNPEYKSYCESEHLFFEENGMGLDESKIHGIFYFEQDMIVLHPKYAGLLQFLEEDIEDFLHIFQYGIGYFFLNKNIKKLNHGDKAGIFFIQKNNPHTITIIHIRGEKISGYLKAERAFR